MDIDEKQLKIGIKMESDEHGLGPEVSRKIAIDHLIEIPDYYDRLIKMEKEAEEPEEAEEVEEEHEKESKPIKGRGYQIPRVKGAY